jgi:2-polyprenyl-3-methyl-5-hydroxy-6-metoxy-1,4-benzoquinol methylase
MEDNNLKEKQYNTADKYNARILIHAKYGTNKTPWPIWLYSLYHFGDHARIIDFGCGNGLLWKVNSFRINKDWQIDLTDFSQGMIDSARSYIGPSPADICYKVVDLSQFAVGNTKYTNIIANHMLYHIEDREKAIRTIFDILEPGGEFYASTVGLGNMQEMKQLVREFTGNDNYSIALGNITDRFSLENGAAQILTAFDDVEMIEYPDALEITDANDLVNYVFSCNDLAPGIQVLPEDQREAFTCFAEDKIARDGKIKISKSSGTFIAGKK